MAKDPNVTEVLPTVTDGIGAASPVITRAGVFLSHADWNDLMDSVHALVRQNENLLLIVSALAADRAQAEQREDDSRSVPLEGDENGKPNAASHPRHPYDLRSLRSYL